MYDILVSVRDLHLNPNINGVKIRSIIIKFDRYCLL